MGLFVNWWSNRWKEHIKQTVYQDDFRVKVSRGEPLPYLVLIWRVTNNSMTDVRIVRVRGDLFARSDWRIAQFDTYELSEKWALGESFPPQITVNRKRLKKPKGQATENSSGLEVRLFPPIEFWVAGEAKCSLWNAFLEVSSHWGNVKVPIKQRAMSIEDTQQGSSAYCTLLRQLLSSER